MLPKLAERREVILKNGNSELLHYNVTYSTHSITSVLVQVYRVYFALSYTSKLNVR